MIHAAIILQSDSSAHLHYLQIPNLPLIQRQPDKRPDLVPTLLSACAGIDVEKTEFFIGHYFQDVGVTANEQSAGRRIGLQDFAYSRIVLAGIASDMCHKYGYAVAFKTKVLRHFPADYGVVYVPIYAPQGLERPQPVDDVHGADIAGVPYFIAFGEVLEDFLVEKTVGVG
jgi:hypothetical protein